MKLEESGIYTIPMPAKIEMKTSKKEKSIIIEINGLVDVNFQVSSYPETASGPPCETSARRPP